MKSFTNGYATGKFSGSSVSMFLFISAYFIAPIDCDLPNLAHSGWLESKITSITLAGVVVEVVGYL